MHHCLLTLSWPCLAPSMYVVYHNVLLLADTLVALSCSQAVCDIAISIQGSLLILSWPCLTPSMYVVWLSQYITAY